MMRFSHTAAQMENVVAPKIFQPAIKGMVRFACACSDFDEITMAQFAARFAKALNLVRDWIYDRWLWLITSITSYWRIAARAAFFSIIKADYDHKDEKFFQKFSMMNLDVNFVIIIFILMVALGTGFIVLMF